MFCKFRVKKNNKKMDDIKTVLSTFKESYPVKLFKRQSVESIHTFQNIITGKMKILLMFSLETFQVQVISTNISTYLQHKALQCFAPQSI